MPLCVVTMLAGAHCTLDLLFCPEFRYEHLLAVRCLRKCAAYRTPGYVAYTLVVYKELNLNLYAVGAPGY